MAARSVTSSTPPTLIASCQGVKVCSFRLWVVQTIAQLLRARLTERGAQKRLAVEMGVEQSTVSQWVNGRSEPTADKWPVIEEALGLEAHSIALAKGNVPGRDALPLDESAAALRDLADTVAAITAQLDRVESQLAALDDVQARLGALEERAES